MSAASTKNTVTFQMDPKIKRQVEALFSALGMDLSTAFNIFIRQSLRERRLPFQPSVAPAEWENETARRKTDAILSNPKAERFSRDEFAQWIERV